MNLPVNPPVLPMLAKRVGDLPVGGDWIFEPKWDGFRALVFRDGDEILIQSRDEKSLNRYFQTCWIHSVRNCLLAASSMVKLLLRRTAVSTLKRCNSAFILQPRG